MKKNKKTKLVVWDLFGGSQNSVYHALKYFNDVEIYTFDINENIQHPNQHVIDLTQDFQELIKFFNQFPPPDIILASPLCTSFSWILHVGNDETLGWKKEHNGYRIRSIAEIEQVKQQNKFLQPMSAQAIYDKAVLGDKCLENAIKLIIAYDPYCYYIENPKQSLMWNVIDWNYLILSCGRATIRNVAEYNSYDLDFTQKPTIFLSNIKLDLKCYGIKGNIVKSKHGCRSGTYKGQRGNSKDEQGVNVAIPKLLIVDIFMQMKGYIYDCKEMYGE